MKTVLVTGSSGFIGQNLCKRLEEITELEILRFEKDNTTDDLRKFLKESDFVFHLAGINRPKDEKEFDTGNRGLTEDLLSLIEESGRKIPVLITSSIQAELDNPYGKSKKAAETAIFEWSKTTGNKAFVYRLPNVFGKWCRPNYNSVVATFCNNIANDLEISINDRSIELNLVYIDDVTKDFIEAFKGRKKPGADGYCYIDRTFTSTLGKLADTIQSFKENRSSLLVPNFENIFDRFLYATFTSYLDKDDFSYPLEMRHDDRGWLSEFIKSNQFGQIFVSKTKPGITRGNHWHHTKIEKFLVLSGNAEIKFRNVNGQDTINYKVNGDELKVLDIPAGYTHSIKNTGETELVTLFWSDEIFNQEDPDTYFLEV